MLGGTQRRYTRRPSALNHDLLRILMTAEMTAYAITLLFVHHACPLRIYSRYRFNVYDYLLSLCFLLMLMAGFWKFMSHAQDFVCESFTGCVAQYSPVF